MPFKKVFRSHSFNVPERDKRPKMLRKKASTDYWESHLWKSTNEHTENGVSMSPSTNESPENGVRIIGPVLTKDKMVNGVVVTTLSKSTNQKGGNEVSSLNNGVQVRNGKVTSLGPLTVGSDQRSRLSRLRKYLGNVNLNLRPIRVNREKTVCKPKEEIKEKENEPEKKEKKRKAAERKPSFSQKLLKRFSIKRAYSEADIQR